MIVDDEAALEQIRSAVADAFPDIDVELRFTPDEWQLPYISLHMADDVNGLGTSIARTQIESGAIPYIVSAVIDAAHCAALDSETMPALTAYLQSINDERRRDFAERFGVSTR